MAFGGTNPTGNFGAAESAGVGPAGPAGPAGAAGAPGPAGAAGSMTVANSAALAALASAALPEGTACEVTSLKAVFDLLPSTVTADPYVNVAASGKAGFQWIRRIIRNPAWGLRTAWFIDPQNGAASDDNDGAGAGTPLKTFSELARRIYATTYAAGVNVSVTLVSDCVSTDTSVDFTTVRTTNTFITITGTLGATVYTGTVTSYTAQSTNPAADDNELADNSVPVSFTASGVLASGLAIKRTNSTVIWAWAAKDLGSKTLRISTPCTNNGNTLAAFAANDTYIVAPLPRVYIHRWRTDTTVANYVQCNFIDATASAAQPESFSTRHCWVTGPQVWSGGTQRNPWYQAAQTFATPATGTQGTMQFGGFAGDGTTQSTVTGGVWNFVQYTAQGARLNLGSSFAVFSGRNSHHDTTAVAVNVQYWGSILIYASAGLGYGIGGKGNSAAILSITFWSSGAYVGATKPIVDASSSAAIVTVGASNYANAALPVAVGADGQAFYQTA